ncbi:MAG: ATP-binding protein [Bradymonadaceae bacterium]
MTEHGDRPYIDRVVDGELDELLAELPAVSLEGPRAVGETRTALRRAETVWELDDPAQRETVEAEPRLVRDGDPPILVDEWQRVPEIWDVVRRAVDERMEPGRFLLTGSATPNERPTHSGAGRIVTLRMRPLSLAERDLEEPTVSLQELLDGGRPQVEGASDVGLRDYTEEIVACGFPGLRHLEGRALRAQLDGYLRRIVDTDFEQLGRTVRKPEAVRRWMEAYAAAVSTTASWETIRDAATSGRDDKPAKATTSAYRELLERLWILDDVPAWLPSRNYLSQLAKKSKHHLADPGLATRLLGIGVGELLNGEAAGSETISRDGTLLGHLFESLVVQSLRVYAQAAEARVRHLRTRGGRREVDAIVERDDGRILVIEIKLGGTVDDEDVRHSRWLSDRGGDDVVDAAVLNTGSHAYRREDGVAVVPAALLTA